VEKNSSLISIPVPTTFFLTAGSGEGFTLLNAFDLALLDAGVGDLNLMRLSSILPPDCHLIGKEKHRPGDGRITPVAYAEKKSNEVDKVISASVAVGIPLDKNLPGVIMEYSAFGGKDETEATTREMVRQAFAYRKRGLEKILSVVAEHKVVKNGAVFAGVILGYE